MYVYSDLKLKVRKSQKDVGPQNRKVPHLIPQVCGLRFAERPPMFSKLSTLQVFHA
jgi:hypothetical protein